MYGLREGTDLSPFVGRELELVSIGLHQVNLNFGGLQKIGITIEGDYAVSGPDLAWALYSAGPRAQRGWSGFLVLSHRCPGCGPWNHDRALRWRRSHHDLRL